ncbi:MAG: DinB family protein [Bacteroidetes bacterium]|nr:DinB family protein [Bacteroidota bacterium]MBS1930113.1 DinB family protein [Bacteroidota bacterium]
MPRPDLTRVPEFYHNYINQVLENDLMEAFTKESNSFIQFFESIPVSKQDYRYAEGKWTIKEVLQHIIDAERVFIYRALVFARKDNTPLPSFDEDLYAKNSKASSRKWNDLMEEFKSVRKSAEILFNSFDFEQLDSSGIASKHSNYVLGMGYIIIGHSVHHKNVVKERYL